MFKRWVTKEFLRNVIILVFLASLPAFTNTSPLTLDWKNAERSFAGEPNLADRASGFRVTRRDVRLVLGNRHRHAGRGDSAVRLVDPLQPKTVAGITDHTEQWEFLDGNKKETTRKLMSMADPTLPEIDNLINGPPHLEPGLGSPSGSEVLYSDPTKLNDLPSLNSLGNPSLFLPRPYLVAPQRPSMDEPVLTTPETSPFLRFLPVAREYGEEGTRGKPEVRQDSVLFPVKTEGHGTSDDNDGPVSLTTTSATTVGDEGDEVDDDSTFPRILTAITGHKHPQCLRVPMSTALIFIAIIMFLACCCALLVRNRLVACCSSLREKPKSKKQQAPQRNSLVQDMEKGIRKSLSKRKRSSGFRQLKRKRSKAVTDDTAVDIGTQNSITTTTTTTTKDTDELEPPTGCCSCCKKKKKKKSGQKRRR